MFLPENEKAIVDIAKLRDYCLNPNHPVGKHKAKVFASALGFAAEEAECLRDIILEAVRTNEVLLKEKDEHGQRYQLDFAVVGLYGVVIVRAAWIMRTNEAVPRLTTCYVL